MRDAKQRLAAKLSATKGQDPLRIVRGVVVSVSGSTATVTLRGEDIPGIPFYAHVAGLTAGSNVDVLMEGDSPIIMGRF